MSPWIGPGADDGDLDHQVIEIARPHPGQEVHLGPALDLEDAQAVRLAQHVVGRGVVLGHGRQRQPRALVRGQEVEGLADARQHAQRQHVDLQDAQRVDVVLVPLDDRPILHRGVLDGAKLVQPPGGDDEAADMLGEVAGEADDLLDQGQRLAQAPVFRVEADLAQALFLDRLARPAPDLARQRGGDVGGEPHGLADLADRRARAEVDDGRRQPGALPAIAFVDVLDHLLAALVLEVDVDVGGLVAGLGHEALEDHRDRVGRDFGHAQCVADGGVGGRAAALAEDAAVAGEADDVVDGQEIGRVAELADQGEFAVDQVPRPCGTPSG